MMPPSHARLDRRYPVLSSAGDFLLLRKAQAKPLTWVLQ